MIVLDSRYKSAFMAKVRELFWVRAKKSSKERKRARRLLTTNLDLYYSRISNLILEMVRRAAIEMGSSDYRPPIISTTRATRNWWTDSLNTSWSLQLENILLPSVVLVVMAMWGTLPRPPTEGKTITGFWNWNTSISIFFNRYYCKNQKCYHSGSKEYVQNKDVSAAVNMVFILLGIIFNGARPAAFSKPVVAS